MPVRGIRGASTAASNTKEEILAATRELLLEIKKANQLIVDNLAAIIFTVTEDLDAAFPAEAARELGWQDTPLLCSREIQVAGSLANCIRVLLLVNTEAAQSEMNHVYLRAAVGLRS